MGYKGSMRLDVSLDLVALDGEIANERLEANELCLVWYQVSADVVDLGVGRNIVGVEIMVEWGIHGQETTLCIE